MLRIRIPYFWLLVAVLLLARCAARSPRTIEEARRLYEKRAAKARGNPTLVPYFPPTRGTRH